MHNEVKAKLWGLVRIFSTGTKHSGLRPSDLVLEYFGEAVFDAGHFVLFEQAQPGS